MSDIDQSNPVNLKDFYEDLPYPNVPASAKFDPKRLDFRTSLTTAQYARTRQIINPEGAVILNAGCGSGWETLSVAWSNPGAKIVGVDLSPASVKLADQRLKYHGYWNSEFYVLDLLDLDQLNMKFDFISCNDVLYLLDSPGEGLKVLASVLKPDGIIYANLHNYYGRRRYLEMQEVYRLFGLFDLPRAEAIAHVRSFVKSLDPKSLPRQMWSPAMDTDDGAVMNNYLLVNDKAYTIPQMLDFLKEAGLGLITLADFGTWDLSSVLLHAPDFFNQQLDRFSGAELLHLYELLAPNSHRLINFWAEPVGSSLVLPWSDQDWLSGTVQLNPVLFNSTIFSHHAHQALASHDVLTVSWLGAKGGRLVLTPHQLAWLTQLLSGPMAVQDLIQVVVTKTAADQVTATDEVLTLLQALEEFLFVMLQPAET